MLDTQILVHMQAGRRPHLRSGTIASVAAKEFLITYSADPDRERYYASYRLTRCSPLAHDVNAKTRARHATMRQKTDRLIIDFSNEQASVVEYGNRTFAQMINDARADSFEAAIAALSKDEQRALRHRFRFLVERSIKCFALEEESLAIGLDILAELLDSHAPKQNFLNTLRDTMILGVAVKHGIPLQTEDKLLGKLAAARFGVELHDEGDDVVVDFGTADRDARRPRAESRGYINRGWRIAANARLGAG